MFDNIKHFFLSWLDQNLHLETRFKTLEVDESFQAILYKIKQTGVCQWWSFCGIMLTLASSLLINTNHISTHHTNRFKAATRCTPVLKRRQMILTFDLACISQSLYIAHSIRKNVPWASKKKKEWKKNNTHGLQGSGLTKCIGQEVEDPRSHPDPTRHVYMSCSWERNHINIQHTYGTSSHSLAEWIPTFLTFLKYLSGWKILHLRQKGNHSRVNRE